MKTKVLYSAIALALTSGCATQIERPTWEIRPAMGIRHGMRSADAHYQLGRYYQGQNRLKEAERAFQRALGEDDRHIGALNALGALYASQGDLDKALATFRHVETLASDRAYLHNNLGFALLLQGRHEEALEQLTRAVTLDPGYERAWTNLAELAKRRGDAELARHVERRSLAAAIGRADVPAREQAAGGVAVARAEPAPVLLTISTALAATPPADPAPLPVRETRPAVVASGHDAPEPPTAMAAPDRHASGIRVAKWSDGNPAVRLSPIRTLELELPPATKVDPVPPRPMRLEVSNGNGVRRFATRFGSMLDSIGVPVSRVTNHSTFSVEATVIEYKPGFEAAAADLNERLNLKARLVERKAGKASSDVRVVLGRDLARRAAYLS